MSWTGYLVLGLVALTLAPILWTGLSVHDIKGKSVDPLESILPELAAHKSKAVVYAYSAHCGACRKIGPRIDRLCQQHPNLFKLDIARHPQESRSLGIRATPTTLLVEEGKVIKAILGAGAVPMIDVFLGNGSQATT